MQNFRKFLDRFSQAPLQNRSFRRQIYGRAFSPFGRQIYGRMGAAATAARRTRPNSHADELTTAFSPTPNYLFAPFSSPASSSSPLRARFRFRFLSSGFSGGGGLKEEKNPTQSLLPSRCHRHNHHHQEEKEQSQRAGDGGTCTTWRLALGLEGVRICGQICARGAIAP